MKLKLDENLGTRGQALLRAEGHDVSTVVEQSLQAATDDVLLNICSSECRALVTLDLDFANPLRFPPENTAGIAVLRLPAKPAHGHLLGLMHTFATALRGRSIAGQLWIVEAERIRIHDQSGA